MKLIILVASFSFVGFSENFTLALTHGFTIKAPNVNEPQYFDLTSSSGSIIYIDDADRAHVFDPYHSLTATPSDRPAAHLEAHTSFPVQLYWI
jgi:hypothetical protein